MLEVVGLFISVALSITLVHLRAKRPVDTA